MLLTFIIYNVTLFITKLSYTLIDPLILNFDTTKKYRLKSAKHLYFWEYLRNTLF